MNNFYEIDTGIFINIGRSTENILNVINYIANYFDNIHNINSREEIWFTLRRT